MIACTIDCQTGGDAAEVEKHSHRRAALLVKPPVRVFKQTGACLGRIVMTFF